MPAIDAGDVIWTIGGDARQLMSAMTNARRAVGAAMAAAGAAVTAFAAKSVADFTEAGSAINDMSLRTGFGVKALQELGYAAGLSGGSLEDIEKASKKLSKSIIDAAEGTETAVQAFDYLGLSYADLSNLSPEEQFKKVAFSLAKVEDVTLRTSLAQELFGRSGTALLPMLSEGEAGFAALAAEAQRLGIVMSSEDISAADALGDAIDKLKAGMNGFQYQIAAALAPTLTWLSEVVLEAMKSFADWRRENAGLVDTITKVLVGVGLLLGGFGPFLILLPGLTALFSGVAAAIGAISWPVVLVGGALIAGAFAVYQYMDAWGGWHGLWRRIMDVFDAVKSWFAVNWEQLQVIFGIGKDALLDVVAILWRGLQTAFKIIGTAFQNMLNMFGPSFDKMTDISWNGTESTLDNVERLARGFEEFTTWLAQSMDALLNKVDAFWDSFAWLTDIGTSRIGKAIAAFWDLVGPMLTWNPVRDWLIAAPPMQAGQIPQFVDGGMMKQAGMALVGERGPELVSLPRGAQVHDSQTSAAMAGATTNVTLNFGAGSVRSDDDIRMIERAVTRVVENGLRGRGFAFT